MANIWIGNNQISTYIHIINHARIMSTWFILPFCRSICEVLSYRKIMHPPQHHGYVMFKSRMRQIVRIHDAVQLPFHLFVTTEIIWNANSHGRSLYTLRTQADILLCSVMCRVCRHSVLSFSTLRRVYLGHEVSSIDC